MTASDLVIGSGGQTGLTYLHERDGKPFHWGKLKIHEAQLRTESPVSPRAETQIRRASIYSVTL